MEVGDAIGSGILTHLGPNETGRLVAVVTEGKHESRIMLPRYATLETAGDHKADMEFMHKDWMSRQ